MPTSLLDPVTADAYARYAHLRGRHTHDWDRFVVTAWSFSDAAKLASALGWWLHCWDWAPGPKGRITVVDRQALVSASGR